MPHAIHLTFSPRKVICIETLGAASLHLDRNKSRNEEGIVTFVAPLNDHEQRPQTYACVGALGRGMKSEMKQIAKPEEPFPHLSHAFTCLSPDCPLKCTKPRLIELPFPYKTVSSIQYIVPLLDRQRVFPI